MKRTTRKAVRMLTGLVSVLVLGIVTAGPALAQYPTPPTEPPTVPVEEGVAFTGADITLWMVLLAALVVVGIAAIVAARRRSRTTA